MTLLQGAECGKIIEARSITAAEIDQTSASQLLSSVPKSNEMVLICQQNDETTCASSLNRDDLLRKFLLVLKLASVGLGYTRVLGHQYLYIRVFIRIRVYMD